MLLLLRFLVLNHGFGTLPKEDSVKKKKQKTKDDSYKDLAQRCNSVTYVQNNPYNIHCKPIEIKHGKLTI
jgi:hypothetical protein